MEEFKSYVPDQTDIKDISIKAVILGAIFGVVFGSANAYLGLRVGLTISTAIPLAVISVAVLRVLTPLLGRSSILECNIAQTTGSASSSLGTRSMKPEVGFGEVGKKTLTSGSSPSSRVTKPTEYRPRRG